MPNSSYSHKSSYAQVDKPAAENALVSSRSNGSSLRTEFGFPVQRMRKNWMGKLTMRQRNPWFRKVDDSGVVGFVEEEEEVVVVVTMREVIEIWRLR